MSEDDTARADEEPPHEGDGHDSEGREGEGHEGEGHKGEEHGGEGHKGEEHGGEGHEGQGHEGQGHEGQGHEGQGHDHGEDRPAYDPHKIELPSRQPPLRSTAPQSQFATTHVVRGAILLLLGLALTFGLGVVLA